MLCYIQGVYFLKHFSFPWDGNKLKIFLQAAWKQTFYHISFWVIEYQNSLIMALYPLATITSLKNYYYFYLCMYMWIYVHHISTIALEVRWHWVHGTGGADGCKPPDVWVLKTELRPSIGIFSTLNFWAISSVPQLPVFNTKFQQDQEVFCDWRLCGGTALP